MKKDNLNAASIIASAALAMRCNCAKCKTDRLLPDNSTIPESIDDILSRAARIIRALALNMDETGRTGKPKPLNRHLALPDVVTLYAAAQILIIADEETSEAEADAGNAAADSDRDAAAIAAALIHKASNTTH